jgi:hypothetical protein
VASRATVAIEGVSGCAVHEIGGDPAIVTAELDCGGAAARG